jgi:hypothetical protein
MWGVLWSVLGSKAGDIPIVMSFDPLGWEVETCSDRNFEIWELHVFNIPFRGLVIGFLVISHLISKSSDLLTKSVFHHTVDHFTGSDGFKEPITDGS